MTQTVALDPSSKKAQKKFELAAKKYLKRATKSRASARRELVAIGIYTPTGRLTKKYR